MGYDDYDFDSFSSYRSSSYNNDDATKDVANALGGFLLVMYAIGIAIFVLYVVALWKIFTKAGEQGWKSIIPIYNAYTLYKIVWKVKYFWIFIAIFIVSGILVLIPVLGWIVDGIAGIVLICITIMMDYYLARSFGHSIGFTLGLVFFAPIFILIIAFSSKYVGNGYEITQREKAIFANPNMKNVNMV